MLTKPLISIFAIILFFAPLAPVEWVTETNADMGDLEHHQPAAFIFKYKNTGTDSLYIDNIRTSCGCTSPDWEDIYVAPDSIGYITIEYDADDLGYFEKSIKVYFNGYRKAERLSIEGFVE